MKIGHNPDTATALSKAAANKQQAKAAAPAPAAEEAAQGATR
ncbi:flagellar biosynthesis anti-sigma factor FlgM, partial [Diaphorobacter sp. DS2]